MNSNDWLAPCDALSPVLRQGILTLSADARWGHIDTIETLSHLWDLLSTRSDVRVLVIELGPEHKGELSDSHWQSCLQSDPQRAHRALQMLHRWRTRTLKTLPQAVLTLIRGRCSGASLALVEGSDVALATPDATFELTQVEADLLGSATEPSYADTENPAHESPMHPLKAQSLTAHQALDRAWITLLSDAAGVEDQVQALTQSWLDKDPLALQFTKETLAHVGGMSWDASVNYTAAKFAEIKARQAALGSSSRADAIAGFLAGQSKPGLKG